MGHPTSEKFGNHPLYSYSKKNCFLHLSGNGGHRANCHPDMCWKDQQIQRVIAKVYSPRPEATGAVHWREHCNGNFDELLETMWTSRGWEIPGGTVLGKEWSSHFYWFYLP